MTSLDWTLIDKAAEALGISEFARKKWRQRGVPAKWWLPISRQTRGEVPPEALESSKPENVA